MKFTKKTDILIIGGVALFGLLFWLIYQNVFDKPGTFAEIYYQSELVERVDLTRGEEYSFSIDQAPNVVFHLYSDGSIAFIRSDCPDKVCVQAGKLDRAGQFAACLPNKLYMKIVSNEDPGEADIIIG